MNLRITTLFFVIPGAVIFVLFQFVYPSLISAGIPIWWTTFLCLWVPLLLLLAGVFFLYRHERPFLWQKRLTKKEILMVLLGFLIVQVAEGALGFTRPLLASLPGFSVPAHFPDLFRPDISFELPFKTLLGMPLKGNLFAFFFFALWVFTNIFCEEILWRGFALPRMVNYFGKYAWLVNGLFWNIAIHFFFRFSFITLIPISLVVPYLSQKYRSLWPGVIIHGLGNSLIFVLVITGYRGTPVNPI